MEFKRDIYKGLLDWKAALGRKPLLLMGARQIGKTTILKAFGIKEYDDFLYINLEREVAAHSFFVGSKNPQTILDNLSLFHGKDIMPKKTLVVLDEIQECRDALTALKYFDEERPDIHIIGAGSLLGLTVANTTNFPVGKVDFLDMYPLSFAEYLNASNPKLYKVYHHFLNQDKIEPLPEAFFNPLHNQLKEYILYGGMPEVASSYLEHRNMKKAQDIQDRILRAYEMDFVKHADKSTSAKIKQTWQVIPAQLASENKKFIYSVIRKSARASEFEKAILWLNEAGLAYKVNRIKKVGLPLKAYEDLSAFKLYVFETGILIRLARLDPRVFVLGNELFTEFKGALVENFVCTALKKKLGWAPYYWNSKGIAEIDFVIENGKHIIPIEVKSGTATKSKSLSVYKDKYHPELRVRISKLNLKHSDDLLNIPLFYAEHATHLIKKALNK